MWGFIGKLLIVAGLAAALYVQTIRLRASEARYAALGASVSAKTAQAQLDDQKHVEAVKSAQDAITKEKTDALDAQLAAARSDAANYARRLRSAIAQGGSGTAGMPSFANPSGSPDGAGQASVMDADALACAEGVTKAQGWQDWWRAVSAVPR